MASEFPKVLDLTVQASSVRKKENADLIKRMREGGDLSRVDSSATWWQPRPIIKKDLKEIDRLYHNEEVDDK